MTGHRTRSRRRGEALNTAIYQATLDELAEVGFAKLSVQRVAERARTGKGSLYRRWPSRIELVLDAVRHLATDPASLPDTGSLRSDLLAWMRSEADLLAGPAGEAMRGLLCDALADPSRTGELRGHSCSTGRRAMREITRRAVDRGEVNPGALTQRRLDVGPSLLWQHFLLAGAPIPDPVIVEIVDEVVVPLLRTVPLTRTRSGCGRHQ